MKICAVLIVVLFLSGCYMPAPYVPPPSLPPKYGFHDNDTPYPNTREGAQMFLEDVREPHWSYVNNDFPQDPVTSYLGLSGDCDDFAIMIAFFLEEWWFYDTFVLFLSSTTPTSPGHAVCYVKDGHFPREEIYELICPDPTVTYMSARWRPVDFYECVLWDFDTYKIGARLQNYATGEVEFISNLDWDETFNYAMSVR